MRVNILEAYDELIKASTSEIKNKPTEVRQKIEKVEERFAYGEIEREIYERIS